IPIRCRGVDYVGDRLLAESVVWGGWRCDAQRREEPLGHRRLRIAVTRAPLMSHRLRSPSSSTRRGVAVRVERNPRRPDLARRTRDNTVLVGRVAAPGVPHHLRLRGPALVKALLGHFVVTLPTGIALSAQCERGDLNPHGFYPTGS